MSTVAVARPRSRAATQRRLARIFFYAFTIVLSVMFLFPFIWTLSSSLKTSADVVAYPPHQRALGRACGSSLSGRLLRKPGWGQRGARAAQRA